MLISTIRRPERVACKFEAGQLSVEAVYVSRLPRHQVFPGQKGGAACSKESRRAACIPLTLRSLFLNALYLIRISMLFHVRLHM
jgi:hypothetical protein